MSWEWLGYADAHLRWLYTHFPKPDMSFILNVSPSIAYQRKKETHVYPLYYYKLQKERYLKFAKTHEIKIIDTEKAVDECLRECITELRRHLINKLSNEDKVLLLYSLPEFKQSTLQELNLSFDWPNLNWSYIVDMAVKCSTENVLCKNLLSHHGGQLPRQVCELLKYFLEKSNENVNRMVITLKLISRELGEKKIPFLVMKTIAPFNYGVTDIDILVRRENFERTQTALSLIFNASKGSRLHKAVTYQGNLLPVDLHHEISWLSIKVMDEEKIWSRKRSLIFYGLTISVPSIEDEVLILALHSVFQHHYTTLGEVLFISSLMRKMHYSELEKKLENQYVAFIVAYCSLKERFVYGKENFQLSHKVKLNPTNLLDIVFFHPSKFVPKRSLVQFMDYLLGIYRELRFRINGMLPYNKNWIEEEKKYAK